MLFTFLLVVHALIAAALVAVILMQRSEGGGLGMGGSPSGLMSARGAADFLTRSTTVLATLFVLMSIGLAALATVQRAPRTIDASLARPGAPALPVGAPPVTSAPAPGSVPFEGDPLAGAGSAVPATPATKAADVPASSRTREATGDTTRRTPTATPRASENSSPAPAAATAPATTTPPAARVNSPSAPPAIQTAPTGNSSAPQ